MGFTNDVLRKKKRMTEGELCESVECSGKNKEQKNKKKSKGIFLVKGERKC